MSILSIILTILLPPLPVALHKGLGGAFWLCLLLTLIGWLPGVVYAFYTLSNPSPNSI
ncbi:YqaE/Pmp3 family membrane protein [Flexithrix dorotheae]|uniref:YqaE/Pmp3 family membrane protein n=1 Tax=Flexithrix dorotheae TaxID=70993 RepID=UPI0009FFA0A3|nr:YqaE/Pmp3 family membrane protein [Flexithrix dorotheae]